MRKTLCSACGCYFSSNGEFDAHRIGAFNRTPSQRRCMTQAEMAAAGFSSELARISDETGRPERRVWFRQIRRDDARKRLGSKPAHARA